MFTITPRIAIIYFRRNAPLFFAVAFIVSDHLKARCEIRSTGRRARSAVKAANTGRKEQRPDDGATFDDEMSRAIVDI